MFYVVLNNELDHFSRQRDVTHKRLANTIGVAHSINGCSTRSMRNVETNDAVTRGKL